MLPHWRHAPSLVSCPGLVLCGQQGWFLDNVARNSPVAAPNLDFASLELQRFEQCSKNDRGELRATFIRRGPVIPPWPCSSPAVAPSAPHWWRAAHAEQPGPAAHRARPRPLPELRPETWTRLMVAVMRLVGGPDLGILPGSGP